MTKETFRKVAHRVSEAAGTPAAFGVALVSILGWLVWGMLHGFSDSWQLVISTITNIATFLMVFLIQNGQNRDSKAVHLKLDELIRGMRGARTELVNLEELDDEELERLHKEFRDLHERVAKRIAVRKARNKASVG